MAFASHRAVAFVGGGPTEMLAIDAPGEITAMHSSPGSDIVAVVAKSENPSVILVGLADKAVRGALNGAGSLEVDAVAVSQ